MSGSLHPPSHLKGGLNFRFRARLIDRGKASWPSSARRLARRRSKGGEGSHSRQLPRQPFDRGPADAWGFRRAKTGCPGPSIAVPLTPSTSAASRVAKLLGQGTSKISTTPSPYSAARTPRLLQNDSKEAHRTSGNREPLGAAS